MAVLLLLITLRLLTPLALAPPLLAPRTTVPAMIDSAESSLYEQRRSWTCSEPLNPAAASQTRTCASSCLPAALTALTALTAAPA